MTGTSNMGPGGMASGLRRVQRDLQQIAVEMKRMARELLELRAIAEAAPEAVDDEEDATTVTIDGGGP